MPPFVANAEIFISSDCPVCKHLVDEMRVQLGANFSKAVIVKDVEKEVDAQRDLLKLNFLSTPVLRIEGRNWTVNQLSDETIRQVCTNLSAKL